MILRTAPLALLALMLSQPAAAAKEKSPDDIVCKSDAKTGTRFRTRDCRTRAQWDELAEQNQRNAKEMIDVPIIETRRE